MPVMASLAPNPATDPVGLKLSVGAPIAEDTPTAYSLLFGDCPAHYLQPESLACFPDVTIVSDESSSTRLVLPRVLLAAVSPFWRNILLEQSQLSPTEDLVVYVPVPPAHLSYLGQFLTSGFLPLLSTKDDIAQSVFTCLGLQLQELSMDKVAMSLDSFRSVLEVEQVTATMLTTNEAWPPVDTTVNPTNALSLDSKTSSRVVLPRKAKPQSFLEFRESFENNKYEEEEMDQAKEDKSVTIMKLEKSEMDEEPEINYEMITPEVIDPTDAKSENKPSPKRRHKRTARPLSDAEKKKRFEICGKTTPEERLKHFFPTGPRDSSLKYQCHLCSYGTDANYSFKQHERRHTRIDENHYHFCLTCDKGFEWPSELFKHRVVHRNEDHRLECEVCGKKYSKKAEALFLRHVAEHNDPDFRTCVQCGKKFYRNTSFKLHQSKSGKYHSNACMQCPGASEDNPTVTFNTWSEHQAHVKFVHNGVFRFVCGLCPITFSHKEAMWSHRVVNHESKEYKEKGSTTEATDKKVCDICGVVLSAKRLCFHKEEVHGTEQLVCQFDDCKKVLKSKRALQIHERRNHQRFPCDICGKMQRNKFVYRNHMSTMHTQDGQKPFQCRFCHRGFGNAAGLRQHEFIHTDERPYKCQEPGCDKAFNSYSNRTSHVNMVHRGIKRVHKCRLRKKMEKEEAERVAKEMESMKKELGV